MGRTEKTILIILFTIFLSFTLSSFIFAQRDLEVEYPEFGGIKPGATISLPMYVKYIFNFSLGIAGLITFISLLYGGIRYLTSVGNPLIIKNAKDQIAAAILGLAVLLGSYLILTTINPQLIFLQIPERKIFEKEEISQPVILEKETLAYAEIPIGGLIEELLSEERLKNIKDVVQKTQNKAEEVKKLSEALKALTDKCQCSRCDKGFCIRGSPCRGSCADNCQCSEDPCGTDRAAINQKRAELKKALSESETDKGLGYWRGQLEKEIAGSRKIYEDLKSAEELIKNCPLSNSKAGKSQMLLGYRDFWEYRRKLEEEKKIKGVEPEYPFNYISSDNPYYLTTFYCAEVLYPITSFVGLGEEYLSSILKKTPEEIKQKKEPICENEIPIGETVDDAEELARKILVELNSICDNIPRITEVTEHLIDLPEQCKCPDNCSTRMIDSWACCCSAHTAASSTVCVGSCCVSCYCETCSGEACPYAQINSDVIKIRNIYNEIESSNKKLKNLIEEKKPKIFNNLNIAQNQLGPCYNSKETQRKVEQGKEKVPWKELHSCSYIKQSVQNKIPFYDEKGEEITECYGSSEETTDLFDNFFCCETELFSE